MISSKQNKEILDESTSHALDCDIQSESSNKQFQSKFDPFLTSTKYLERLSKKFPRFNDDKRWHEIIEKTPSHSEINKLIKKLNDETDICYNCNKSTKLLFSNNKNSGEAGKNDMLIFFKLILLNQKKYKILF